MKKTLIAALLSTALILNYSCDTKDDEEIKPKDTASKTHTIEENKASIEASAIAIKNSIERMEDLTTLNYVENFASYAEESDPMADNNKSAKETSAFSIIGFLKSLKDGKATQKSTLKALKAADEESIQAEYDSIKGIYDWNSGISDWDFVDSGDDLVFNFPAEENGTSNNAEIRISYTGTEVDLPFGLEDEYTGDLPSKVTLALSVDGETYISYETSVTYLSTGLPRTIKNSLTIDNFSLEYDVSYDESKLGFTYAFKENGNTIIGMGTDISGKISVADVDTYINDEDVPNDVVSTFHTYFQISKIKIDGTVKTNSFMTSMRPYFESEEEFTPEDNKEVCKIINDNISLDLEYASGGEVIASFEAFPDTYTDTEWEYDYNTYEMVEVTKTYHEPNLKIVWPDGSSVTAEVYFDEDFENDFSKFITEMNVFIDELNSDYDMGIDHM